ncbi:MAG: hydratase [Rhizobiales bacterium]|nr:hydratase [Hyphomicrobiales bacterium]
MLFGLWQEGKRIAQLPADIRPESRAEGYRIQSLIEAHSKAPLFGWKIAATSKAGQAHINVDGPLAGRLLAERVHGDGATLPFGANHMKVVEGEFAFRMARDLPPRAEPYTAEEAVAAVADLYLALEIPDTRFDDVTKVGTAQIIADNACAHDFVLGPKVTADWRSMDLAAHPTLGRVAEGAEHPGKGANVLGDPRLALAWLANELSGLGVTLKAGQVVTTGTSFVPLPVKAGDRVSADFGALGRVSLRFSAS